MKILFKTSNSGGIPPTVNNTDFQDYYGGINAQTSWKSLLPAIKTATKEHLIPAIGQELYDDIADLYHTSEEDVKDEKKEFLQSCKEVVALFAMLHLGPELNISFSNMGAVEKGSSQGPVMPVAQWRYKEFKYEHAKRADRSLDRLISLLEGYVKEDITFFNVWKDSVAYLDVRTSFFESAVQFDQYVKINKSRRMFAAIKPGILWAEEDVLKLICQDQYDALKDAVQDGDATNAEDALLDKIRRYVSARAIEKEISSLSVTIDAHGVSMSSYSDGVESKSHPGVIARGAEMVGAFVRKMQQNAEDYFRELVLFIHKNIDEYPLIKNSDCYTEYKPSSTGPLCTGDGAIFL